MVVVMVETRVDVQDIIQGPWLASSCCSRLYAQLIGGGQIKYKALTDVQISRAYCHVVFLPITNPLPRWCFPRIP